jgi:hypothetical protein
MRRFIVIGVSVASALALLGCGERQQSASTRKADAHPYTTATGTHTASGWKAGDAVGWERQMTSRTQNGQNEYTRTGGR